MVRETRRRAATLRRTGSQGQWRADIRVATRLVSRHVHSGASGLQRSLEPRSPEHGSASSRTKEKKLRNFEVETSYSVGFYFLLIFLGLARVPNSPYHIL